MLAEIAELLGHAAAARLALALGGREIRVPVHRRGRTWDKIVAAIGEDAAARFCDYFEGERIYIAGSQRLRTEHNRAVVAKLRAQGKSWSEIAKAIGYTERGARKLLEKRPGRAAEAMLAALGTPPTP
jgi:lambda repressor-like predicted transcriptional regulator